MNTHRSNGSFSSAVSVVLTLLICGVAVLLFLNRQYVADQVTVWRYNPSDDIRQIVETTTMHGDGELYFYASTPAIESAEEFNQVCESREQNDAILGCYAARKIYIYDVTDERLNGVREVTAAHEMLHAAYDRLSSADQSEVNELLEAEYQRLSTTGSEELQTRMEYYARTEPGERANELHSIIGTEVEDISDELEEYYARYFKDRSTVVALYMQYNGRFAELKAASEALRVELDNLAASINAETEAYNANIAQLNADIEVFNARAERGDFDTQASFQAERSVLAGRVEDLESARTRITEQRQAYEEKRQAYNATADEANSLTRSLDSSPDPTPDI